MAPEIIPPPCRNCGDPSTVQIHADAWECPPCAYVTRIEWEISRGS